MIPDGEVSYRPHFVEPSDADRTLERLLARTDWERLRSRFFGRDVELPRLTAWWGDPGASYRYSGITHVADGWPFGSQRVVVRDTDPVITEFGVKRHKFIGRFCAIAVRRVRVKVAAPPASLGVIVRRLHGHCHRGAPFPVIGRFGSNR